MRLLCGLDHSTTSLAAACFAAGVARRLDAELTLVHVVEPPAAAPRPRMRAPLPRPEPRGDAEEALAERARSLAQLTGAQVSACVEGGLAAPTLARLADERSCDLLVVGSGGRRSAVARRLAAAPPCPVALVPEEATSARVQRIVVACDGGAAGDAATKAAGRFALALDAEVVLLHRAGGRRARPTGWERYDAERRRRREARAVVGSGVALHVAERSDPVGTLAAPLGDDDGDAWVVVGQRRGGPLAALLRAPLASRVARRSRQPVIAVPA